MRSFLILLLVCLALSRSQPRPQYCQYDEYDWLQTGLITYHHEDFHHRENCQTVQIEYQIPEEDFQVVAGLAELGSRSEKHAYDFAIKAKQV